MIQKISTPQNKKRQSEAGNVFLFILIGIVLFAAISFVMSRGFRSEGTSKISERQVELAAADILNYSQRLRRGVDRVRRSNCSENDVSFENNIVAGYNFATSDDCKVFHPSGGNVSYTKPSESWLDSSHSARTNYQDWYFTNSSCIEGVGNYQGVDCHTNNPGQHFEVFAVLKYLDRSICEEINRRLHGSTNINSDANPMFAQDDKYVGDFTSVPNIRLENGDGTSRCMTSNSPANDEPPGSYHFFTVLIER